MLTLEERKFLWGQIYAPLSEIRFDVQHPKPSWLYTSGSCDLRIRLGALLYHFAHGYHFARLDTPEADQWERDAYPHLCRMLQVISPPDAILCYSQGRVITSRPKSKLSPWAQFKCWMSGVRPQEEYGQLINVTQEEGPWWDQVRQDMPKLAQEIAELKCRDQARKIEEAGQQDVARQQMRQEAENALKEAQLVFTKRPGVEIFREGSEPREQATGGSHGG